MKGILIPVPEYGFDPTETAIPWKILSENKFPVFFATPRGEKAKGDRIMLTGEKLGPCKKILQARYDAVAAYSEMERSEEFCRPLRYDDIHESDFDGLLLPGGHDKGVKEYLESKILQHQVASFFNVQKPVAAICHGVVLAARSTDPVTQKSVLYDYKTTSLLSVQERTAYRLTQLWLKDYYLTYPGMTVEYEVTSALRERKNFISGPKPLYRDDLQHLSNGFAVVDRNYISARWPGDAYNFSLEFVKLLEGKFKI
jgi:protease I